MSILARRRLGVWMTVAGGIVVAVYGLRAITGIGGEAAAEDFNRHVYDLAMALPAIACIVRATLPTPDRGVWIAVAVASVSAAVGNEVSTLMVILGDPELPLPSAADVFWLGAYLPTIVALLLLLPRGSARRASTARWTDAVLSGMTVATVSTAFVLEHAIRGSRGTSLPEFLTNVSYPALDLVTLAVAAGVLALRGWRLDRRLALLAAAPLFQAISDSLYVSGFADGSFFDGGLADMGWLIAGVAFAAAAWSPKTGREIGIPRAELVIPVGLGVIGAAVLAVAGYGSVTATTATVSLGVATLVATLARMAVSLAENHRLLAGSRHEALTDPVTGLGNRRRLMADLAAAEGDRLALTIFDLNGFKAYNDTFGHAAGDALLTRIGAALRAAVEPDGGAYRMGGDEFSAITPADGGPDAPELAAAMAQHGDGFRILAAHGRAVMPDEADGADAALRLADRRMYAQKHGGRAPADHQVAEALLAVVSERNPGLAAHSKRVAELVDRTAVRIGAGPGDRRAFRLAALLHDIGMLSVPEPILSKPGPLAPEEWSVIHKHPLAGERVLAAAPDLQAVAQIVRSSHERWDGAGYPDRLAGEDIPLGARLLFVCDAYHAMLRARPHLAARSPADALVELRGCAGSQFDPDLVAALTAVLAEDAAGRIGATGLSSAARPADAAGGRRR